MQKVKHPKIGEYVLATRWGDKDPCDPWYVGFIVGVLDHRNGLRYYVKGSDRQWKHVWRISKEEGAEWLKNFAQHPH